MRFNMAEQKTKPTEENVSKFLDSILDEGKRIECYTIAGMMEKISGEKPVLWGPAIIGFGKYHYKYESGHEGDAALISFSPRKQNITLYLMLGLVATEFADLKNLLKDLGKFKLGKGCLYIDKLGDVNIEKLKELIESSLKLIKKKYG
jgi:hypothetical protein